MESMYMSKLFISIRYINSFKILLLKRKGVREVYLDKEIREFINKKYSKIDEATEMCFTEDEVVELISEFVSELEGKEESKCEHLIFTRPFLFKEKMAIDEFGLNFVFQNDRTAIYENDDVRFSFDKKVIRVLLYDGRNKELNRIQDYFYEKQWKQ